MISRHPLTAGAHSIKAVILISPRYSFFTPQLDLKFFEVSDCMKIGDCLDDAYRNQSGAYRGSGRSIPDSDCTDGSLFEE